MNTDNFDDFTTKDDVWQTKDKNRHLLLKIILVILLIFGLLIFRAFWLQIAQGAYFKDLASGNRLRRIFILPARGAIVDKNNKRLAYNQPAFVLTVSPIDLSADSKNRDAIYATVKQALNLDIKDKVEVALTQGSQDEIDFPIDISQTQALILEEKWSNLNGITISDSYQRQYANDVANIMGYIGNIQADQWPNLQSKNYLLYELVGQAGLESQYQDYLRGQPGAKEAEVDAFGKIKRVLANNEPMAGNNLKLTLDYGLQEKAKQLLQAELQKDHLAKGSLVALNPKTGGVLAMVSLPDYNNNAFVSPNQQQEVSDILTNPDQPMFNRAISGLYPSGSTIKPVMASAGLQAGVINENTNLWCGGSLDVPNQYDPSIIYHYNENISAGYGYTDVKKALAKSVNVFFYQIGGGYQDFKGLGVKAIDDYMNIFGLGQKTGIDLPQESVGLVPTPDWKQKNQNEPWYLGDTYNLSIGQGNLLVTPLQVARYTMAIANGGTLYQPYLLQQLLDPSGKILKNFQPAGTKINISNDNLQIVQEGMRQCVTDGSCNQLQSLNITSAGKTGTAEDPAHSDEPHAWFTGFAPYEDPGIVVTVMAENAGQGYNVAEPVAKDLLTYWQDHR
jgi:penicillin-binding protein 2